MNQQTPDQRKNSILSFFTLELAIEDRFTNLRIWLSKKDGRIRFRLDRANMYSCTLKDESIAYLERPNPIINKLNELYGFMGATVDDLDNIIELTKKMADRQCVAW